MRKNVNAEINATQLLQASAFPFLGFFYSGLLEVFLGTAMDAKLTV